MNVEVLKECHSGMCACDYVCVWLVYHYNKVGYTHSVCTHTSSQLNYLHLLYCTVHFTAMSINMSFSGTIKGRFYLFIYSFLFCLHIMGASTSGWCTNQYQTWFISLYKFLRQLLPRLFFLIDEVDLSIIRSRVICVRTCKFKLR